MHKIETLMFIILLSVFMWATVVHVDFLMNKEKYNSLQEYIEINWRR